MDNLKKVGLTALAGALVSVSANAADLSVTGGASISFAGEEETTKGNGWSMNDGITFTASGEMDNGFNITVTQVIDSSDGNGGAGGAKGANGDQQATLNSARGPGPSSVTTRPNASVTSVPGGASPLSEEEQAEFKDF